MARANKPDQTAPTAEMTVRRLAVLAQPTPVGGITGPGRWLIARYEPTALFSLKVSSATSSVGKTLIIPTPYSIKMALVDASFRLGFPDTECDSFLKSLIAIEVRVAPSDVTAVTHTFVKVRQESRKGDPTRPYDSTIAYREIAHNSGDWLWAFDLAAGDDILAERLVRLAPCVNYVGKRGSFIQFRGLSRWTELNDQFTQPIQNDRDWSPPARAHVVLLDDFGPDADLPTLSSFTAQAPKRDRHRKFVQTIIPMGLVNTGPGFSEYRRR